MENCMGTGYTEVSPPSAGENDTATDSVRVHLQLQSLGAATPAFLRIGNHALLCYDAVRTLLVDGELVHFTPTEYQLISQILRTGGLPVAFEDLTRSVFDRASDRDARRLLDKHVDHIRSKLRPLGLNVRCVARYGYLLLPDA
jgi:DNA-binding response OmpR family regulator